MTRAELEALKLTPEQIDAVMKAHGQDIEKEKDKFADYDEVKKQYENAKKTIESFGDVDAVKADVEKYKQQAANAEAEYKKQLAALELEAKVKDFTSNKKFVNDFTRAAINSQLKDALNDDANKGKSLDELFKGLTEGKENIFTETPTPPKITEMGGAGGAPGEDDDAAVRAIMGLPPKK